MSSPNCPECGNNAMCAPDCTLGTYPRDIEGAKLQNAVTEEFRNAQPIITKEPFVRESMPLQPHQDPNFEHILRYFKYDHLPARLQIISAPFAEIAHDVIMRRPRSPERTVALRKLLESKDATVRAALDEE
jgi:hypothetical protein